MKSEIHLLLLARDLTKEGMGATLRRSAGLSQRELVRAADGAFSLSTLRAYEQGRRRPSGRAGEAYGRILAEIVRGGREAL